MTPTLHLLRFLCLWLLLATASGASAQRGRDTTGVVRRSTCFGVGRTNVLDTYLSPLEYTGWRFGLQHTTERTARFGGGHVRVQARFAADLAQPATAADGDDEWDSRFSATLLWHYRCSASRRLWWAPGLGAEASGGFTYSSHGGNNPATGRAAADVLLSIAGGLLWGKDSKPWQLRAQVDIPVGGACFAPRYGESYFEIFDVGSRGSKVQLTSPFNAPSIRTSLILEIPLRGCALILGYGAEAWQYDLHGLKRHTWNHSLLVGFSRWWKRIRQ